MDHWSLHDPLIMGPLFLGVMETLGLSFCWMVPLFLAGLKKPTGKPSWGLLKKMKERESHRGVPCSCLRDNHIWQLFLFGVEMVAAIDGLELEFYGM